MKTITLKIEKEECKDKCPLPLELIPKTVRGIKKIKYNENGKIAEITYDETIMSKKEVIDNITEIGYKIKKEV